MLLKTLMIFTQVSQETFEVANGEDTVVPLLGIREIRARSAGAILSAIAQIGVCLDEDVRPTCICSQGNLGLLLKSAKRVLEAT